MAEDRKRMTGSFGTPVDDDQNAKTAGDPGPIVLQDVHLLEKLAQFQRDPNMETGPTDGDRSPRPLRVSDCR